MISAAVQTVSPKKARAKPRALVRQVAQGTLLAMTIATARLDLEGASEKRRLFDVGLLDRLRAPITRIRD